MIHGLISLHRLASSAVKRDLLWLFAVILFCYCLPANSDAAPSTAPVINGQDAQNGAFPWMGSLHRFDPSRPDSQLGHFCGAVIVSSNYALTAAHCAYGMQESPLDFELSFNLTDLAGDPGERRRIVGVTLHPEFDRSTLRHDLALLKLEREVDIVIPNIAGDDWLIGEELRDVRVLGWGTTDPRIFSPADLLQTAIVPRFSDAKCSEILGSYFDPSTMFCAGILSSSNEILDGVDTCSGDSGSPVIEEREDGPMLVGLTSWGFGCATDIYPGVYAEVASHKDWILSPNMTAPEFSSPHAKLAHLDGSIVEDLSSLFVGDILECHHPELVGDAVKISYQWFFYDQKNESESRIAGEIGSRFEITDLAIGRGVFCRVTARNSVGVSVSQSLISAAVIEPPQVESDPESDDFVAPSVESIRVRTIRNRSEIIARVSDLAPSSGVKVVFGQGDLISRGCIHDASCRGSRRSKPLNFSALGDSWRAKIRIPRGVKFLKLAVRAVDQAGNVGERATQRISLASTKAH